MKHKFIKTAVVLVVLLLSVSILCGAVGAAGITFSDVDKAYWGYNTIMKMAEAGIFKGATEPVNGVGTFLPEKVMTRAEFITSVLRAIYPEETKFIENGTVNWWSGYYNFALLKGIIKAGELDNGDLYKEMSRQEMAMVLVRCVEIKGEQLTKRVHTSQIADYSAIGTYYKDFVVDCFSFGLLAGVDELGTFAPSKSLRRVEAATVLCRLIDKDERVDVKFIDTPNEGNTGNNAPVDDDTPGGNTSGGNDTPGGNAPGGNDTPGGNTSGGNDTPGGNASGGNDTPGGNTSGGNDNSGNNNQGDNSSNNTQPSTPSEPEKLPWKEEGAKKPSEYTWAEYQALSESLQQAFYESFESEEAFEAWFDKVQTPSEDTIKYPWEKEGAKQPSEYTWAEYEALPEELKNAFYESFESKEVFEEWFSKVQPKEQLPWEKDGAKKTSEYTWAEYEALPETLKNAFYESFESESAFEEWFNKVQPKEDKLELPWEQPGGKQPSEYTWEEFEALPDEIKAEFANGFDSMADYVNWLKENHP